MTSDNKFVRREELENAILYKMKDHVLSFVNNSSYNSLLDSIDNAIRLRNVSTFDCEKSVKFNFLPWDRKYAYMHVYTPQSYPIMSGIIAT
mmetsp:Transcript_28001/g.41265  ORF Transcript_28001/g.41265 Transcript_28001/m.41265 type:complete len:91 (-) Transcript_28001:41-313(-)